MNFAEKAPQSQETQPKPLFRITRPPFIGRSNGYIPQSKLEILIGLEVPVRKIIQEAHPFHARVEVSLQDIANRLLDPDRPVTIGETVNIGWWVGFAAAHRSKDGNPETPETDNDHVFIPVKDGEIIEAYSVEAQNE
jgi:hypothetical protein